TKGERLSGLVVERLRVGSYTYLDIEQADHSRTWAVVLGAKAPAAGEPVELVIMGERRQFRSARLDRTFDTLIFAAIAKDSPNPSTIQEEV
ncbi:MAG: hypothetical protein AAGC55_15195, partial [Myxococcota bacterium]